MKICIIVYSTGTYLMTMTLTGACRLPFSTSICAPQADRINTNLELLRPTT